MSFLDYDVYGHGMSLGGMMLGGAPQFQKGQIAFRNAQYCDIGIFIGSQHLTNVGTFVVQYHFNFGGTFHYVVVGNYVAVRSDHHPGA